MDDKPDIVPAAGYLESLLLWFHERPHMYCMYVGELEAALWYLHMAWAKVADREAEYEAALYAANPTAVSNLSDEERRVRVALGNDTTTKVLELWSAIDQTLGLQIRVASLQQ